MSTLLDAALQALVVLASAGWGVACWAKSRHADIRRAQMESLHASFVRDRLKGDQATDRLRASLVNGKLVPNWGRTLEDLWI